MDSMMGTESNNPPKSHFFRPILPEATDVMNIPVTFFNQHIKGKHEGGKMILMTDHTAKEWKVKIDGQKMTHGWSAFRTAHDIHDGDICIFRHEGNMRFHVTIFGRSCCEVSYVNLPHKKDKGNNGSKSGRKEKQTPVRNKRSDGQFVFKQTVTSANLRRNGLYLPSQFASECGLLSSPIERVMLKDDSGMTWESKLHHCVDNRLLMIGGWRSICEVNSMVPGEVVNFKLLRESSDVLFEVTKSSHSHLNKPRGRNHL